MNRSPKILRVLEFLLLFIGLPVVFYFDLIPVPKVVALLIVMVVCITVLWGDSSYDLRKLFYRPQSARQRNLIIVRSLFVAGALGLLVLGFMPDLFLVIPREKPQVWLIIMALYPVLSALPQELIYREFFFQRYEKLFATEWTLLLMSAASFSFLHIIYDNSLALILTFMGGLLFAKTYRQTRSLYWVSVEHAIYGCLVFTVGLGQYFYEGF